MTDEEFAQQQDEQEREEMETLNSNRSRELKELFAALAKAQAELGPAIKGSENPHFKSSYADLTANLEAALPVLARHELALIQMPGNDGGRITVTTILGHSSGQYIESTFGMTPSKPGPHAIAACVTYIRRYSLSIYGAFADDDDANAAQGSGKSAPIPEAVKTILEQAAKKGTEAFRSEWKKAARNDREAIVSADAGFVENMKAVAGQADATAHQQ